MNFTLQSMPLCPICTTSICALSPIQFSHNLDYKTAWDTTKRADQVYFLDTARKQEYSHFCFPQAFIGKISKLSTNESRSANAAVLHRECSADHWIHVPCLMDYVQRVLFDHGNPIKIFDPKIECPIVSCPGYFYMSEHVEFVKRDDFNPSMKSVQSAEVSEIGRMQNANNAAAAKILVLKKDNSDLKAKVCVLSEFIKANLAQNANQPVASTSAAAAAAAALPSQLTAEIINNLAAFLERNLNYASGIGKPAICGFPEASSLAPRPAASGKRTPRKPKVINDDEPKKAGRPKRKQKTNNMDDNKAEGREKPKQTRRMSKTKPQSVIKDTSVHDVDDDGSGEVIYVPPARVITGENAAATITKLALNKTLEVQLNAQDVSNYLESEVVAIPTVKEPARVFEVILVSDDDGDDSMVVTNDSPTPPTPDAMMDLEPKVVALATAPADAAAPAAVDDHMYAVSSPSAEDLTSADALAEDLVQHIDSPLDLSCPKTGLLVVTDSTNGVLVDNLTSSNAINLSASNGNTLTFPVQMLQFASDGLQMTVSDKVSIPTLSAENMQEDEIMPSELNQPNAETETEPET